MIFTPASIRSFATCCVALAELAEGGQVAADLRCVDVRVGGDLLRGGPLLAHLLRLRQHLEVPGQARCHTAAGVFAFALEGGRQL
jgi:hypothetical protein